MKTGVNLGGWLSQFREYDPQHFKTFITADDIQRVTNWGFDHVRLPIDYPMLEDDARPGVYKEDGFAYIDRCLDACKAAGLQLVLDLHKAPGFSFDTPNTNSLFSSRALQDRFVALWQAIARRYPSEGPYLFFELLNEVFLPDSAPWNDLVRRTIAAIRQIDRKRWIIVGGNHHNAADQLDNLELFEDEHIIYTFHFYEPIIFTHQKAHWFAAAQDYDTEVNYPGECPGLAEFLQQNPHYQSQFDRFVGVRLDREWVRAAVQPAIAFARRTGKPVYCGEYGAIDRAPMPSRLNWCRDATDILNEAGIDHTYWTYKAMDFGLVDASGQVVSNELVQIVSRA
ncbi:MAG TPA: glycoside hydrolase family 5 protein [Anaerolineae bacterium]